MSLYPSSPDTVCSGQCPASQCATLRISLSMIAGPTHWSWAAIKHGHMSMHHTLCQPIVSLNTKPTGRPLILHFHFLIFVPLNQSIGVDPFFQLSDSFPNSAPVQCGRDRTHSTHWADTAAPNYVCFMRPNPSDRSTKMGPAISFCHLQCQMCFASEMHWTSFANSFNIVQLFI